MSNEQKESELLNRIRFGDLRLVKNKRRAKMLKKRGEKIEWSNVVYGWVWECGK